MKNTKTYVSKANTIFRDSPMNTGINPVLELNYGKNLSRMLVYIDHSKVKSLVEDKTYPDISKLKHVLKLRNTASITTEHINRPCFRTEEDNGRMRAQSFDLIFFHLPYDWDAGRGFEYREDLFPTVQRGISLHGSNWYQYKDYHKWDYEGVYSTEKLSRELDFATSKEGNRSQIIFGYQHFDAGNEDIELDITCTFNKFITGELENRGFGIAFSPMYEEKELPKTQYVGFFSQHTHSFFEPYVETTYDETIEDDRTNFYLDKDNKLYFYSMVGGNYTNLDEVPACTVDGEEKEVRQVTKGIYCVDVRLGSDIYEPDTMVYDNWSGLKYNGRELPDVRLQTVTKNSGYYFNFGLPNGLENKTGFIPSVYGINYDERIKQGETRKVNIDCRIPYTGNQLLSVEGLEYRVYVVEAERQYDVIAWSGVERGYNENWFVVDTSEMLPFRYFVDIRVKDNLELKYYYKVLQFDVVSDITEEAK
ncbi:MAG: hypothetical protein LUD72_01560 [Bacteroidales bacterium]|nr:hypothetical protein [Bacteroidales bacterium]